MSQYSAAHIFFGAAFATEETCRHFFVFRYHYVSLCVWLVRSKRFRSLIKIDSPTNGQLTTIERFLYIRMNLCKRNDNEWKKKRNIGKVAPYLHHVGSNLPRSNEWDDATVSTRIFLLFSHLLCFSHTPRYV